MATVWSRRYGFHAFYRQDEEPTVEQICKAANKLLEAMNKEKVMHYRNGREAKNGDRIVQIGGYGSDVYIEAVGILHGAKPGNDHCNGNIAPVQNAVTNACLCDCLHVDDLAAILKEKGLDKRPAGK